MSSSTEVASATGAPAWPVPGTDGQAVIPWVVQVTGADGVLETLAPLEVVDVDGGGAELLGRGTSFEASLRVLPADTGGGAPLRLEIRSIATEPVDAAVTVVVRIDGLADPWFLVPGLFYGENRPEGCAVRYPRWSPRPADPENLVSDRWSFRSDRAATPLVVVSDGARSVGVAVDGTSALGPTGLLLAGDGRTAEVGFVVPFAEQPVVYDGGEQARPGVTMLHRWGPGEQAVVEARLYVGAPGRDAFAPILRDLHARSTAALEPARADLLNAPAAAALAAEGLLRWHWRRADRVLLETAAFERGPLGGIAGGGGELGTAAGEAHGDRLAMHVGWVSGIPAATALLVHGRRTGNETAVRAGIDVIDNVCEHLAPAGTFWGQWTGDRGWGKGWTPGEDRLHARTLAEATLFAVRAIATERDRGVEHDSWVRAVTSNLEFVAAGQRADGGLGSAYHGRTGVVESWEGTAGLAWVPALVEGAHALDRPAWLDVARRAGDAYAHHLDAAFLHGAPEDVDLAPTSEDGYVAVMAYVALAAAAEDEADRPRWLDRARRAADWMLTFRYTYDVSFPPESLLGRNGYQTLGMDQASVANQHLHVYGLVCTPELVTLARLLGDPWYEVRAREHLVAARQLLLRVDGEANGRRGMAPERFYQTDCFGPKGGIGMLSHAWCLGLLVWANEATIDG